jgi:hypothetical protein
LKNTYIIVEYPVLIYIIIMKKENDSESEMFLLDIYRKWLMNIKKYIKEYAFEKYWWNWLENVEFSSHKEIIQDYTYNNDFLDRLVKTNKIDLDKTENFYWEEWFKHIWFWKYLEYLFWNNDDYRIIFLIDVLK